MKKEIKTQQENINELIKLISENPTLRVLPIVDSEVVGDDYHTSWLGKFGEVKLDYSWQDDERIYFKSIDEEELVDNKLEILEFNEDLKNKSIKELSKIAMQEVNNLEWEKVIVVNITTP